MLTTARAETPAKTQSRSTSIVTVPPIATTRTTTPDHTLTGRLNLYLVSPSYGAGVPGLTGCLVS